KWRPPRTANQPANPGRKAANGADTRPRGVESRHFWWYLPPIVSLQRSNFVGNWANWLLVIAGVLCAVAELALGVATGFDLALVGASLAGGGAIGLLTASWQAGLVSAIAFALLYYALFRGWLRTRLSLRNEHSNVDAVVGKTGVVTKRIAGHEAGIVKV